MTFPRTAKLEMSAWIRLMQLSSPSLPTGSFAYSNGLETLVDQGHIRDETGAIAYLVTLIHVALERLDLPRLARMHRAWLVGDTQRASLQSRWLYAAREGGEIQAQERQMGAALRNWFATIFPNVDCNQWRPFTAAEVYARACVASDLDETSCCIGFAYTWAESHVSALARLIPLGPMASQRLLSAVLLEAPDCVTRALALPESEIDGATPGLGLAVAQHELQYTRLFRS
jgi:urease accessory protein